MTGTPASVEGRNRAPEERVLLISPVRNEAAHLARVIDGVKAQERPPDLWIVVDDGSSDGTGDLLKRQAAELPWLTVCATPRGYTADNGDRLTAAGPDRAFNYALDQVDLTQFTHLGKLDGDIVLPPDYLRLMLQRFRSDPELGMAGGAILEQDRGGGWRLLSTPSEQVTAPARLYTRVCFEAIGGMPPSMGADVITTTYARMRGFRTRTFADLRVQHRRAIGTAQGALRGRARHGAYQYIVHYSFFWVGMRSLLVAARFRPRGVSGIWFLAGYLGAALRRAPRVSDPEFRAFMRADQRARLRRALRHLTGREAGA